MFTRRRLYIGLAVIGVVALASAFKEEPAPPPTVEARKITVELPDLKPLLDQIRKDTKDRPIVDEYGGVRNWTHEDIEYLTLDGDRLIAVTNLFPKDSNMEPAARMCRYLASYSQPASPDLGYGFRRVAVMGQARRMLATCTWR